MRRPVARSKRARAAAGTRGIQLSPRSVERPSWIAGEAHELVLLDPVRRREEPPNAEQGGAGLADLVAELP